MGPNVAGLFHLPSPAAFGPTLGVLIGKACLSLKVGQSLYVAHMQRLAGQCKW